jgi:hypothetical protein
VSFFAKSGRFHNWVLPLLVAFACSCVVVIPFIPSLGPAARLYAFEVEMASDTPGQAQFFYNIGRGFGESDSVRAAVSNGAAFTPLRFLLPTGDYTQLRLDPIDHPAHLRIKNARIVTLTGELVHRFSPADFTAQHEIASLEINGDTLAVATATNGADPNLGLSLPTPLELADRRPVLADVLKRAASVCAIVAALMIGIRATPESTRSRVRERARGLAASASLHPARGVMLIALIAMVVSSYPVIFLGKSYVSPNFSDGTNLLYGRFPTLPGYTDAALEDAKGADVGAIIWQQVPYSFIQHRALIHDHELPLWNRYNSGGSVLLGQGQSMFGDPLHVPVILARGAAWAWDLKYLVARWLLCAALGLLVLRGGGHLPAACVATGSAAFLGFFIYRLNHPAYFSFCYAPWLLYAWIRIADAVTWRELASWCALLILASCSDLNSGTVKEAYMLLFGMYLAGGIVVVSVARSWLQRAILLSAAALSGLIFVLLTAPTWLTLLDSLKQAYTSYALPVAYQIHPSVALGFFDEIFYRPLITQERVFNPSANFITLIGVLYFIASYKSASTPSHVRPIAWGALIPAALVFGVIPPQWITQIPFVGNVVHIDNSFSCVLIVLCVVISGFGWHAASRRLGTDEANSDLGRVAGLYALLVVPWIALTQTVHRPTFGEGTTFTFLHWGQRLPVSNFVWGSLVALTAAGISLLLGLRWTLRHRRLDTTATLLLSTAVLVLLWRHGQHTTRIGAADYVFTPEVRAPFHADSPAIDALKADTTEPARAVGFGDNLFPGWTAAYEIEGVSGADALLDPRYRELISGLGIDRIWDWRIYLSPAAVPSLKPALDFLNVRHYVGQPGEAESLTSSLTPVKHADLDVFRSETAWPRAFFVSTVSTYETPEQLGQSVREARGPFAAVQISDLPQLGELKSLIDSANPSAAFSKASRYHLTTNTTSFELTASAAGVAVLHETWLNRCFEAKLNGQAVPYFRVNHAFKGIFIPRAGTYRIEFTYRPRRFITALLMAGGGLALGLAVLFVMRAAPLPPLSSISRRQASA